MLNMAHGSFMVLLEDLSMVAKAATSSVSCAVMTLLQTHKVWPPLHQHALLLVCSGKAGSQNSPEGWIPGLYVFDPQERHVFTHE